MGVPASTAPYRHALGTREGGPQLDLSEQFAMVDMLRRGGVGLI